MDALAIQQTVREIVEPTVTRCGFELVAVEWLGGHSGAILRLSIDASAGVTIADCAHVSTAIGPVLDESDPVEARYNLEVSSPGIGRPVQRRADFVRFVGYELKVKLVPGHPRRNYRGQLSGVDGDEILMTVDTQEHRIALVTIERAHLDVVFTNHHGQRTYVDVVVPHAGSTNPETLRSRAVRDGAAAARAVSARLV